ncbi:hypothetical protein jhhlp_007112 [Lomentospora prolificans]|uniref:Protoporphyrinogen oxidase n=1 Tax=Lomentospora prolificans TaxID=41688 RepID=A0A2N3N1P7_9PEZI|nr:hypothetical protein jhhlp_007112 [Lomentospora prolificans]
MDIARVCPGCLRQTMARTASAQRLATPRWLASTTETDLQPSLRTYRARDGGSIGPQRRGYATVSSRQGPPENVAVIGGGITGLTTAYYLAKFLPKTSKITLYEAHDRVGGWIHTIKKEAPDGQPVYFENGPRMLRGLGGSGFRADDYVFYDLFRDPSSPREPDINRTPLQLADLELAPKVFPARNKLFCYNDELVRLPPNILNPLVALKTSWQLLRGTHVVSGMTAAALGFRRANMREWPASAVEQDVSIGDWIRMTFGDAPAPRNALSAMMHGIYGGNVDRLSMPTTLPAVWFTEHMEKGPDEVLLPRADYELLKELDPRKRGMEDKVKVWSKAEVMSFPDGMASFAFAIRDELEKKANVVLQPASPVSKLRYIQEQDRVELSTPSESPCHYDKVISTTSSATLAPILPAGSLIPLNTEAVTICTVSFFFPQADLTASLGAFGYLVPLTSPNPEQMLGMFFDSDTYGLHADEKRGTKVTILLGGHFWSDLPEPPSEAECIRRARAVLARHVGVAQEPELTHANLAKGCITQHVVSHRATMAAAHEGLRDVFKGRLAVAGGSYTAVGVMPAMRAGYDVACQVAGRGATEHVGETGLAQFGHRQGADVIAMPRTQLNELGKQLRGSSGIGRWFSGK